MRRCMIKFAGRSEEVEGFDYPDLTDEELVRHWTEGWSSGSTVRYGTRVHGDAIVPESVRIEKS